MKKRPISFISMFLACCLFVSGMPLQVIAAADLLESSALSTAKIKQEKLSAVNATKVLNYVDSSNNEDNPCSNPTRNCYKCDFGLELSEAPDCIMMTLELYNVTTEVNNGTSQNLYCEACKGTGDWGIPAHLEDHHFSEGTP